MLLSIELISSCPSMIPCDLIPKDLKLKYTVHALKIIYNTLLLVVPHDQYTKLVTMIKCDFQE